MAHARHSRARRVTEGVIAAEGGPLAHVTPGSGRIVCVALHAGHDVRDEVRALLRLADAERLREEDPFTAEIAPGGFTRVEVVRSRFEVDLNRPRERCVYLRPDDAWGLDLYRETPSEAVVAGSLRSYDAFYQLMEEILGAVAEACGRFVVFDLHSYNHRRDGATEVPAPAEQNPEVNLGTASLDRASWGGVADAFLESMAASGLDARENVKFGGGAFARWVNGRFADKGCALAIEFKKTFMDEWTGRVDALAVERLAGATRRAALAVDAALGCDG